MPEAPATIPTTEGPVTEIPASSIGSGGSPTPPKPGSAKAKLFSTIGNRAKGDSTSPVSPVLDPARPGTEPTADTQDSPPAKAQVEPPINGEPPPEKSPTDAPVDAKGKKLSPWKLVDQFKERAVKAEARALELDKQVVPEAERKATTEKITKAEARLKELEDELRYHNAEKYDPEIVRAENDFQAGWKRATAELGEISVTDQETGEVRAATTDDLWTLVTLPAGKARVLANATFGVFADDMMAHRKELRNLFDAKASKLAELKKNGSEREQARQEQWKNVLGQINEQIKTAWEESNASSLADEQYGKYFKPREGDTEWNTRLEKGTKLVDEAFSVNVHDPRLSPEDRAKAVRRHAAVRNRAISWGALRSENDKLTAKIVALEKDLKDYKGTTPAAGGTSPATQAASTGSARQRLHSALESRAKPA